MAGYIESIHLFMEEARSKSREGRGYKEGSPEWRANERDTRRLNNQADDCRQQAKLALATINDCKPTNHEFAPHAIGKHHDGRRGSRYGDVRIEDGMFGQFFDHHHFYRKNNRCFAIVTEPYITEIDDKVNHLRPQFHQLKLDLFLPPDPMASIWFPGATSFVVIAPLGSIIEWLPEQDGGLTHLWESTPTEAKAQSLHEMKYGVEN